MLLFILTALLLAPVQRPSDVVKWSAESPAATVSAGGTARIRVTAQVQPGWKLYAIEQAEGGPRPLTFAMTAGAPFTITRAQIVSPKSKVQKQDENFAIDTHYYEKEAVFTIPVIVPRSTAPGPHELPLEVTFQACGAELCLRPFTQKLPVRIAVAQ